MMFEGGPATTNRRIASSDARDHLAVVGATSDILAQIGKAQALLSPAERRRVRQLRRDEDRADFIAAHVLVRFCAARLLGTGIESVTVVQACSKCGGPHGKPAVAGVSNLHLSMAHSRGVVAAAAGSSPVGIDVEALGGARISADHLELAFIPEETRAIARAGNDQLAMLRQWVRKEALVKVGVATVDTLRALNLAGLPIEEAVLARSVRATEWNGWCLVDLLDPDIGAIGTVAARVPISFDTFVKE